MWRHDSQYNDNQHNDTQYNDTQHNEIQHNNKYNATLSIIVEHWDFYAEPSHGECRYTECRYAECLGATYVQRFFMAEPEYEIIDIKLQPYTFVLSSCECLPPALSNTNRSVKPKQFWNMV
jgi:hypothetical protein